MAANTVQTAEKRDLEWALELGAQIKSTRDPRVSERLDHFDSPLLVFTSLENFKAWCARVSDMYSGSHQFDSYDPDLLASEVMIELISRPFCEGRKLLNTEDMVFDNGTFEFADASHAAHWLKLCGESGFKKDLWDYARMIEGAEPQAIQSITEKVRELHKRRVSTLSRQEEAKADE